MKQNLSAGQKSRFPHGHQTIRMFMLLAVLFFPAVSASASYTPKQLEAFASRIGKTYWIVLVDNRTPTFLARPAAKAPSFRAPENESFMIVELVGQKTSSPYYRVRFDSDKEGYITPEAFHEEFNLRIVTTDPQADEKKKTAHAAEEDKQRKDWIQAQPWSEAVKEAAISRRPVPGMNGTEIKKVLGNPIRVIKGRGRQNVAEERWLYPNGSELVLHNGLLIRVESKEREEPTAP
jgi:hypothetical protein